MIVRYIKRKRSWRWFVQRRLMPFGQAFETDGLARSEDSRSDVFVLISSSWYKSTLLHAFLSFSRDDPNTHSIAIVQNSSEPCRCPSPLQTSLISRIKKQSNIQDTSGVSSSKQALSLLVASYSASILTISRGAPYVGRSKFGKPFVQTFLLLRPFCVPGACGDIRRCRRLHALLR